MITNTQTKQNTQTTEHKNEVVSPIIPESQCCQPTNWRWEMMHEGSGSKHIMKHVDTENMEIQNKHKPQVLTMILGTWIRRSWTSKNAQCSVLWNWCYRQGNPDLQPLLSCFWTTSSLRDSEIWPLKVTEGGLAIFGHSDHNVSLAASATAAMINTMSCLCLEQILQKSSWESNEPCMWLQYAETHPCYPKWFTARHWQWLLLL